MKEELTSIAPGIVAALGDCTKHNLFRASYFYSPDSLKKKLLSMVCRWLSMDVESQTMLVFFLLVFTILFASVLFRDLFARFKTYFPPEISRINWRLDFFYNSQNVLRCPILKVLFSPVTCKTRYISPNLLLTPVLIGRHHLNTVGNVKQTNFFTISGTKNDLLSVRKT